MRQLSGFVAGVALGAGVMFLLDPTSGRRRRHLLRDRVVSSGRDMTAAADSTASRIRNKARGMVAEARSRFSAQDVEDSVLESRVRSAMGHVISNAGAIAIQASGGVVTISGPVLVSEADGLLSCISAVPGVHEVRSQLQVKRSADGISGLQGNRGSGNEG